MQSQHRINDYFTLIRRENSGKPEPKTRAWHSIVNNASTVENKEITNLDTEKVLGKD